MKSAIATLFLAAGASAATLKTLESNAEVIEGEYVVVMKPGCTSSMLHKTASGRFTSGVWDSLPGIKGFGARLNEKELEEVLANPDVDYVEPNQVFRALGMDLHNNAFKSPTNANATAIVAKNHAACSSVQTGPQSWGQSRVTRIDGTGDFEHESSWGKGVKVYVIDTGSNCEHDDFNKACSCGPSFAGGIDGCADKNGHGTHCASTATGTVYGIAKQAEVVGVKVLGDNGSGSTAGVIDGMNWVASQGAGSVASMSLGGGYSAAMNAAVDSMTAAGVAVVIAAGNDNRDACSYSPASADTAITVGATEERDDKRSSFSNYGKCVDIFAPGSAITAAWYIPGMINTISGTSMATPHVAGAAAAVLSENKRFSPAQVAAALKNMALDGVVSNAGNGSPNKFLHLEC